MAGYGFQIGAADSLPQDLVTCVHLVGDSVTLGKGDPVKLAANSIAIGSGPVKQAVARAASGDKVFGIVVGVEQHTVVTGMSLDRTHCPASTAMYVMVRKVKLGELYRVREDGVGGVVASTAAGLNATMIAANCNTTTGMSGYLLDSSTVATTNTLDLHIRAVVDRPDNQVDGTNIRDFLVSFNNVQEINQVAGV